MSIRTLAPAMPLVARVRQHAAGLARRACPTPTPRHRLRARYPGVLLGALLACALLSPGGALAFDQPLIGPFTQVTAVGGTVPSNGDLNPYGIVTVSKTVGSLVAGNILISNFNNAGSPPTGNLQGTGTTIVQVTPAGHLSLFAQINAASLPGSCPGGVGLTTALAILPQGYGGLSGLVVAPTFKGVYFVNDAENTLDLLH